jgi:alpha/beta superfamily hydrolase
MRIETVPVTTLDGLQLDADLALPDASVASAVVCHPHPLYGGDRFNAVVDALFHTLAGAGVTTLRFDFRGVGDSQGTHGDGVDERLDVAAAIELLTHVRPELPVWLAGYSFGALVALDVVHPAVHGWFAVAPPLTMAATPRLAAADHRPKHLLVPSHDQFSPPESVEPVVASWATTTVRVVESADHFLHGHTAAVAAAAVEVMVGAKTSS